MILEFSGKQSAIRQITKLLYIYENLKNMPDIKINYPLQSLNTFGIPVYAKYYLEINSVDQLPEMVQNPIFSKNEILILGGGSNFLFTKNYEGLVLHVKIGGISVVKEDNSFVFVSVGSGIVWDEFVAHAVSNRWGGIENLSAIPGYTGAAPVQNIGAYGVEAKDVIEFVEGYNFDQRQFVSLANRECRFQYRNSIFKERLLNRVLITRVVFRLSKAPHKLITYYGDIEKRLREMPEQSIRTMRQLVIRIRESKLPDYKVTGNAGSFFKNPVIDKDEGRRLQEMYPEIPMFPDATGKIKLSAAWLIEQAGCKGIRSGNAGTFIKQPLVLINLGNASGTEILSLSNHIRDVVRNKFKITLDPEVKIV